jgi:hypothetical protein
MQCGLETAQDQDIHYFPGFFDAGIKSATHHHRLEAVFFRLNNGLDFLSMSYWSLCVAAFVPAFLYYWGLLVQVHFEARKQKLTGIPGHLLPRFGRVIRGGWFYLLPLALLMYLPGGLDLPIED